MSGMSAFPSPLLQKSSPKPPARNFYQQSSSISVQSPRLRRLTLVQNRFQDNGFLGNQNSLQIPTNVPRSCSPHRVPLRKETFPFCYGNSSLLDSPKIEHPPNIRCFEKTVFDEISKTPQNRVRSSFLNKNSFGTSRTPLLNGNHNPDGADDSDDESYSWSFPNRNQSLRKDYHPWKREKSPCPASRLRTHSFNGLQPPQIQRQQFSSPKPFVRRGPYPKDEVRPFSKSVAPPLPRLNNGSYEVFDAVAGRGPSLNSRDRSPRRERPQHFQQPFPKSKKQFPDPNTLFPSVWAGSSDRSKEDPNAASPGSRLNFDLEALLRIDDLRSWIRDLEASRGLGYQTLYSDYDDYDIEDMTASPISPATFESLITQQDRKFLDPSSFGE